MADEFKIIGYLPSWRGSVGELQLDKLTHVNYAFALPNEIGDGSLAPQDNAPKLHELVSAAHAKGVSVLLSVGGWNDGNDSGFERLAAHPNTIAVFVKNIIERVNEFGLDGVDIDWEYPDPGESGNRFTRLMNVLGEAVHRRGKLLTAAVVAQGDVAAGVQKPVFEVVDFLNIMSYDYGEPHASYETSLANVDYWQSQGLPVNKTVLGVPFYGRPGGFSYRQAVAADRENAYRDCATVDGSYGCYNGIPTMQKKVDLMLQRGAGIMFWESSEDSADDTSLVSAIYARAHSK